MYSLSASWGTQKWYLLKYFLRRDRIIMDSRACNTRFLKIFSIRPRYSTFKSFRVGSASDEIVSSYAQPEMKHVPCMLSRCMLLFSERTQKRQIKIPFSTINNLNFEKPPTISSNRNKANTEQKIPIPRNKKLVLRFFSHCENVRTSKFLQKSREKNRI